MKPRQKRPTTKAKRPPRAKAPAVEAPTPTPATEPMFEEPSPAIEQPEASEAAPETSPESTASDGTEEVRNEEETPPPPVVDPDDDETESSDQPDPDPDPDQESSAEPEEVEVGSVKGQLHRLAPELVYSILPEGMQQRIDRLRNSASIQELQKRMLSTDGRCTPMIFTKPQSEDGMPDLFDGAQVLAAAMDISLSKVSVVLIERGDAGAAQTHIANTANITPIDSEDDELIRRVIDLDD